ncbi:MAG: DUF1579 family protein [Verrucomicrobiota bacterium]
MRTLSVLSPLIIGFASVSLVVADEHTAPVELEVLTGTIGVWDAEGEVWAQGLDKESIKFTSVETNTAFGKHWLASDLVSDFGGQSMTVHSIIGYDLEKKSLVGTVIDQGPYAAKLTGDYDPETKTTTWMTDAKDAAGNPVTQKTTVTQKNADERVLILHVPGGNDGEWVKFMEIRFTRKK